VSIKAHFVMMAQYNAWANERLFRMAGALPDELYRRDVGAYFKSMHGTLNHLLTGDRIWMWRLTGVGDHPARLDAIVFDDLPSLTTARQREDERINRFIEGLAVATFEDLLDYRTAHRKGNDALRFSRIFSIIRRITEVRLTASLRR